MMILCKELLGPMNNVSDNSLLPLDWYLKLNIKEYPRLNRLSAIYYSFLSG